MPQFVQRATGREYRATGQVSEADVEVLGRIATVFAGIKDLPSRVKCAVLPWHTLHAALTQESSASTEGDADPVGTAQ